MSFDPEHNDADAVKFRSFSLSFSLLTAAVDACRLVVSMGTCCCCCWRWWHSRRYMACASPW